MEKLGTRLAQFLPERCVIALNGTLGSGKTRLVQFIAQASGIPIEDVSSPTFVLVQEYHGNRNIFHFDAYRLKDIDEFWELGPEEYFDRQGLTIIEWADRIESALPESYLNINIEVLSSTAREIVFSVVSKDCCNLDSLRKRILHN